MATHELREALLSQYFQDFQDNASEGKSGLRYILEHPRSSRDALIALCRLPRLTPVLSDTVEAAAIRAGLRRPSRFGRTVVHTATALLALPDDPAQYSLGAAKQTLRRKVRAATKLGVHWAQVTDPQEQLNLLKLANEHERNNSREEYRHAEPDNDDLLKYRLWLVAYSREDVPLLVSVTPIDGEWALLRYFFTLGSGNEHSNARYLMTQVLAEHLIKDGVRYLADASSPITVPNGLRHFQRMLGYRVARVHLTSERQRRRAAA